MKPKVFVVPLAGLLAGLVLWLAIVSDAKDIPEDPPSELSWPKPMTIHVDTYRGATAETWYRRLVAERRRYRRRLYAVIHSPIYAGHWLERAFLCIHSGEGAWGSATGNGYYGGLQMDSAFQRSYGPEFLRAFGSANHWPSSVQIAVAIRAYISGRGFGPWPNTARACGLR